MHIFLSNFQYQITLTASRLALNLLERDKIIEFTHYLMNNGYYDDLMLEILDDCNYLTIDELSELLSKTLENLNLITLNKEQAKYFYTFSLICPFIIRPFKPSFYAYHYFSDKNSENKILDLCSMLSQNYHYNYNAIDNIDNFVNYAYIFEENIALKIDIHKPILEFLDECEHWLNSNQNTITTIIQRASLIK
ncbi:Uncharacterised protein [Moraxella caprae]|uniref:Uncharacterized protein n=1 Tax=Moraxella caprae TaxID=90240 RepID=A0A378QYJ9_9GAMM|nr:hypothetical protein [Moraxella caprae]STZ08072.1 Uncharacterised protein [Moraxella caprae]